MIAQFKAEGVYLQGMLPLTWARSYVIMNAVLAGNRPMPTIEEVFAELPVLEWPE